MRAIRKTDRMVTGRRILCCAALGIALIGSGSSIALATDASNHEGATSSAAVSATSTDEAQFINTWELVSLNVGDGSNDAEVQAAIDLMKAMGFSATLDIQADGTFTFEISAAIDSSESETTEGTWTATGDQITLTSEGVGITATLNADGSLEMAETEGDESIVMVFATADDIADGKFDNDADDGTVGGIKYVEDPQGFEGTWTLVAMSIPDAGFEFDEDAFALMSAFGFVGELDFDDDGTFELSVSYGDEDSESVEGTWTGNDSTASLTIEGESVTATIEDGRLVLEIADAEDPSAGGTLTFAMIDKSAASSSAADAITSSAASAAADTGRGLKAATIQNVQQQVDAPFAGAWTYAGIASDNPAGVTDDWLLAFGASSTSSASITLNNDGTFELALDDGSGASGNVTGTWELIEGSFSDTHVALYSDADGGEVDMEYDEDADVIGIVSSVTEDGYSDYLLMQREG